MVCPLCGTRKARRGCPALGRQICAVCCGTKRLVEINCPPNCTWLASAREHPAAVVLRQQQRDLGLLVQFMRDLTQRQSQIFFLINTFLAGYEVPELQPIVDEDVAEAMHALGSTFETASRGVIYEHRPASFPAERLTTALKPLLAEAGQNIGTAFDRDAALALRRVAEAAREMRALDPDNQRAFLELVGRVIRKPDGHVPSDPQDAAKTSRLIVP